MVLWNIACDAAMTVSLMDFISRERRKTSLQTYQGGLVMVWRTVALSSFQDESLMSAPHAGTT